MPTRPQMLMLYRTRLSPLTNRALRTGGLPFTRDVLFYFDVPLLLVCDVLPRITAGGKRDNEKSDVLEGTCLWYCGSLYEPATCTK